jgi:hypothetical protein
MVSFEAQKVLILMKSNSSIFFFCGFDVIYLGGLCQIQVVKVSLFSSKSFTALGLIFRSLINFELTFVYVVMTQLTSFACSYPVIPAR